MARLDDETIVWLTTVRPDASPHLTPIWFVHLRGRIWIGTGVDSVKTRNVRLNPRVAFSLQDGAEPLVGEGRATVHSPPFPPDVVDAFVTRFGWDLRVEVDPDIGRVALWEIEVDHWLMGDPMT